MIDNKNIVLAVVLSIIILVGFDMFFAKDRPAPPPGDQPRTEQTTPGQAPGIPAAPSKPGTAVSSPPEAMLPVLSITNTTLRALLLVPKNSVSAFPSPIPKSASPAP